MVSVRRQLELKAVTDAVYGELPELNGNVQIVCACGRALVRGQMTPAQIEVVQRILLALPVVATQTPAAQNAAFWYKYQRKFALRGGR